MTLRKWLADRKQRKLERQAARRGHVGPEELQKLAEQQARGAAEVQGSGRIQIGGGPF